MRFSNPFTFLAPQCITIACLTFLGGNDQYRDAFLQFSSNLAMTLALLLLGLVIWISGSIQIKQSGINFTAGFFHLPSYAAMVAVAGVCETPCPGWFDCRIVRIAMDLSLLAPTIL
jgi:hypothetical protein